MNAVGSDPLSCFILRAKTLRSSAFRVWVFLETLARIAHLLVIGGKTCYFLSNLWALDTGSYSFTNTGEKNCTEQLCLFYTNSFVCMATEE